MEYNQETENARKWVVLWSGLQENERPASPMGRGGLLMALPWCRRAPVGLMVQWCRAPDASSASSDIHLLPQQLQTEPSYVAHPAGIALWLILCPRYFPNCYCMSVAVAWVSTFFFVSIDNRLCREQIARIKKSSVWSILETWKVSRQGELRVSCAAWWGLNRSRAALRSVWCLW